jgi:hypothetical protein
LISNTSTNGIIYEYTDEGVIRRNTLINNHNFPIFAQCSGEAGTSGTELCMGGQLLIGPDIHKTRVLGNTIKDALAYLPPPRDWGASNGIEVVGSHSETVIDGNFVTNNSEHGIYTGPNLSTPSANFVRNNVVTFNGAFGIWRQYFNGKNFTFTNNCEEP